MKLPWDEKYLRISFHVIFTFIVIYVLNIVFNALTFSLTNVNVLMDTIGGWFKRISSVLSPVLTAFLIAYLLDPLIDFCQDKYDKFYKNKIKVWFKSLKPIESFINGSFMKRVRSLKLVKNYSEKKLKKLNRGYKRRNAGVALTFIMLMLAIAGGVTSLFQTTSRAAFNMEFVQVISKMVNDFNDFIFKIQAQLADFGLLEYLSEYIDNIVTEVTSLVSGFSNNIINVVTSTGSGLLTFFLALVVSVYFMRDKQKYLAQANEVMDAFVPRRANKAIKNFVSDINAIFSGFIRGQLTDALIMAILIGGYLSIINVNYAIMIGVFSGICNLIPYFGAIIAFTLSILVALLSGDPIKAVYAAAGIVVLQQIDGMFIVPRVVGSRVGLSPVLVIISLSVAGSLFGLMGMLLAVPVCAIIKLFLSRFLQRQKLKNEQKA